MVITIGGLFDRLAQGMVLVSLYDILVLVLHDFQSIECIVEIIGHPVVCITTAGYAYQGGIRSCGHQRPLDIQAHLIYMSRSFDPRPGSAIHGMLIIGPGYAIDRDGFPLKNTG